MTRLWNRAAVFAALAIGGGALDLLSKQWIFAWRGLPGENPPWWLIEGYVGIETAVNTGALFGLGAGFGYVFAALSVVAALAIIYSLFVMKAARSWWLVVTLGLVQAGIIGNLYDRLGLWYSTDFLPVPSGVRDWILLRYGNYTWPNFNIADSFLVCGAAMLAWYSFFPPAEGEKLKEPATAE